jgi:ATP-dependent Clp protease ATP-binding subunit ClpB
MSEYQERHAVSRLVGAPPGYVGYEEGGQLTEAVRRKPYSVILLDEIEKAHPDTFNVLLQVLDEGRLTDNKGRLADFKNSIIIMTSNMGSHEIQTAFEENPKFEIAEAIAKEKAMILLKKQVRPEFLNRIDDIVMFSPLTQKEIQKIVGLQLALIAKRLKKQEIILNSTEEAIEQLAVLGFDPQYGGRPVKRTLQQQVLNPLSKALLEGSVSKDKAITLDYFESQFIFRNSRDASN